MHTTRRTRAALAAATFGLVALVAGCGGTSTKATPLAPTSAPTTAASPTGSAPASTPTTRAGTSTPKVTAPPTTAGASAKVPTGTQPTPAQLAAVSQDLSQAGSALSGSQGAINSSNVNQAKGQEGSAP